MYRKTVILVIRALLVGFFLVNVTGSAEAAADVYPPVFKDIELSSITVKGGESITFYVTAEDNDSGMAYVYVQAVSPSGRLGEVQMFSQDALGRWTGSLQISQYAEPGDWKVRFIYIEDKAGNYWSRTYDTRGAADKESTGSERRIEGLTPLAFTVVDTQYDNEAPVFGNLEISIANVRPGESLTFYATAEDSISGVADISVQVVSPSGSQLGEIYMFSQDLSGRWFGVLRTSASAEPGQWKVRFIHIRDNAGNYWSRTYDTMGATDKESTGIEQRIEGLTPMTFMVWNDNAAEAQEAEAALIQAEERSSQIQSLDSVEDALTLLSTAGQLISKLPDSSKITLTARYQIIQDEIMARLITILKQNEYTAASQLGPQTLDLLVRYAIKEVGAETVHDRGRVLGFVKPLVKGLASGVEINKIIIKYLD